MANLSARRGRLDEQVENRGLEIAPITNVILRTRAAEFVQLNARTWVSGRFLRDTRIDEPVDDPGLGLPDTGVFGRNGAEIVAVVLDGSARGGQKGRLPHDDAEALRGSGLTVPEDRIVNWWPLDLSIRFLPD